MRRCVLPFKKDFDGVSDSILTLWWCGNRGKVPHARERQQATQRNTTVLQRERMLARPGRPGKDAFTPSCICSMTPQPTTLASSASLHMGRLDSTHSSHKEGTIEAATEQTGGDTPSGALLWDLALHRCIAALGGSKGRRGALPKLREMQASMHMWC